MWVDGSAGGGLLEGVFAENIHEPRHLFESGEIAEGLRLLLPNDEASLLLARFTATEIEFLHGRIDHPEFEKVKNQVLAAAIKLV